MPADHRPETPVGIEPPTLHERWQPRSPRPRSRAFATLASMTATPPECLRPSGRPRTPMSSSPCWANAPVPSAAAPAGRAATPSRWLCPAPAATPRRTDRHSQTRHAGAAHGAALTRSAGPWRSPPPSCSRSSPARRAPPPSPGCSAGGPVPPAGCRSACRAEPVRRRHRRTTRHRGRPGLPARPGRLRDPAGSALHRLLTGAVGPGEARGVRVTCRQPSPPSPAATAATSSSRATSNCGSRRPAPSRS